jgi:hypothetical protein
MPTQVRIDDMQSDALASKGVFLLCDSPLLGPYLSKCANANPNTVSKTYPGWVQNRSYGETIFTLEGATFGPTDNAAAIWNKIDVGMDNFMRDCIETIKNNFCHLKNKNMATQQDLINIIRILDGPSFYLQAIMFSTSFRYKVVVGCSDDYFDYKSFSIEYENSQLVYFSFGI